MIWGSLWGIRITHLPSGIWVQTDELGCPCRSMWQARLMLMNQLRSKVVSGPQPIRIVREYDLIADTVTDNRGSRSGVQRVLNGGLNDED